MSNKLSKLLISSLSLTGLIIGLTGLSAQAQTTPVFTPNQEALPTTTPTPDVNQTPQTTPPVLAQELTSEVERGRNYVGVGGNIGFGGRTGIGRGNFAVFSRFGLTNNISARPGALIGDRTTVLLPVTVDLRPSPVAGGRASIEPFIGGGAAISTGRDSRVRALVTGGVDVPLTNNLTATATTNVGFFQKTEVGLLLGVGYNF